MLNVSPMHQLACIAICCLSTAAMPDIATAAVVESHVERFDATHVVVVWTAAAPVDLYLSDRPDASRNRATLLSKGNRDGRYMATLTSDRRPYFLLRDRGDGTMLRVSERILPLDRASNFRDVGGYPAAGKKHVRWGLIYRSAATPLLSDHDIASLRALGVDTTIDLRSVEERQLAPTRLNGPGIRYVAIDYPFASLPQTYVGALTALAPEYRTIFRELLARPGPISYSCTAGQDRTGIATALILLALGVSRDVVLEDYHLSTEFRHPEYEMLPIVPEEYPGNLVAALFAEILRTKPAPLYTDAGRSYLAELFDQIDTKWGSVENYLQQSLGIGPAQVAVLRATYLE